MSSAGGKHPLRVVILSALSGPVRLTLTFVQSDGFNAACVSTMRVEQGTWREFTSLQLTSTHFATEAVTRLYSPTTFTYRIFRFFHYKNIFRSFSLFPTYIPLREKNYSRQGFFFSTCLSEPRPQPRPMEGPCLPSTTTLSSGMTRGPPPT
jgi:hypothetical protein